MKRYSTLFSIGYCVCYWNILNFSVKRYIDHIIMTWQSYIVTIKSLHFKEFYFDIEIWITISFNKYLPKIILSMEYWNKFPKPFSFKCFPDKWSNFHKNWNQILKSLHRVGKELCVNVFFEGSRMWSAFDVKFVQILCRNL